MINKFRSMVLRGVNHPLRLLTFFISEMLVAAWLYSFLESKRFVDGLWWTVVTASTVGYGDQFPVTDAGRIVASSLMLLNIFVIACVTSIVLSRSLEDRDKWSHEEQEDLKNNIRGLRSELDGYRVMLSETTDCLRAVLLKLDRVYGEVDSVEESAEASRLREEQLIGMVQEMVGAPQQSGRKKSRLEPVLSWLKHLVNRISKNTPHKV